MDVAVTGGRPPHRARLHDVVGATSPVETSLARQSGVPAILSYGEQNSTASGLPPDAYLPEAVSGEGLTLMRIARPIDPVIGPRSCFGQSALQLVDHDGMGHAEQVGDNRQVARAG